MRLPHSETTFRLAMFLKKYGTYRDLARNLRLPESKIAVMSRIVRGEEGVGIHDENEIRRAIFLPNLSPEKAIYNPQTHKAIPKKSTTRKQRKRRRLDITARSYDTIEANRRLDWYENFYSATSTKASMLRVPPGD